jgi:ribosomal-protein-alanine N-acetyltransferase
MKTDIVIETDHLFLRHFSVDDLGKVFHMSQETGVRRWIPDQVYEDEAKAEGVIRFLSEQYVQEPNPRKAPYVLGVALKDTHELIGHVGLSGTDDGVEIGYAIEEKYQGKGYATEAVRAMSDWAVSKLSLPHVLGIVAGDNKASCRVLEKAGYVFVEEKEKNAFGRYGLCRIYKKIA